MTVRVGGQHTTNTFLENVGVYELLYKLQRIIIYKRIWSSKNIFYECNTVQEKETIQSGVNKAREDSKTIVRKLLNVPAGDNIIVKLLDFLYVKEFFRKQTRYGSVLFVRMNNQPL